MMYTRVAELLDQGLLGLRAFTSSNTERKPRPATKLVCPTCGARAAGSHRFCPRCGRALGALLRPSPEGTVTIVFTDIVNHCELLGGYTAAQAQKLMAMHRDLVRDQLYETGGFEVKFLGDGFMLAFPSARGAVRCAAGVQRALADHNRLNGDSGLVRVGINTGDAVCEDDDFFGLAVSFAARVMAKARGGQILITELTRGLAGSCAGVSFLDRGRHSVKGFPGRHRLFEVEWSGQAF